MATIVLGAVGTAIGGPVGGYIGAAAGSYIDNRWIMPAIFGKDSQQFYGPRINEIGLQMATEGSPIRKLYGPENRVSGVAIWVPELTEVQKTSSAGGGKGGGGGGQKVTNYSYFADLAVALGEGEIQSVKKIWADGKLLYDADPDVTISGATDLSVTKYETKRWDYVTDTEVVDKTYMDINSPNGGTDLSQFRSGKDIQVSGFTEAANNGTFRCILAELDAATGESKIRLKNTAVVIEAAGDSITLFQDLPTHSPAELGDLTVHVGSGSQTADSLISAEEGVTATPAFRHTAYAVLENLALKNYGNRIPILSFLVEADTSRTIASMIGDLLERAGLSSDEYDTSGVSGNVRGFAVTSPQPTGTVLEPVLFAYDLVVQESAGKLYFYSRENLTETAVDADDIGAYEEGQAPPPSPVEITDAKKKDLPGAVNIKFIEANNDYQPGSQREPNDDNLTGPEELIEAPFVMDAADARALAMRRLWQAYGYRRAIRMSLPPSYCWVQENDKLGITVEGESLTVLVKQVDRGQNFLVQIEGVIEDADATDMDEVAVAEEAYTAGVSLRIPVSPEIWFQPIDVAPLRDEDATKPGYYAAVAPEDINADFYGCVIWDSLDGSTYYDLSPSMQLPSVMGRGVAALAAGPEYSWDESNTLTVVLRHGTLEAKTAAEVLSGSNMALIGNEIIAFRTATLTGTNTYQISNMIRGLRGTESERGRHASNERFIMLSESGLVFQPINTADIGATRSFKPVPPEVELADVDAEAHQIDGNTIRPFAPDQVKGARDGSNNLTITWERRSRAVFAPFSPVSLPLLESSERYEIDILDSGTVVRTISGDSDRSETYTAAQQTTDGLTPGDPVDLVIYQLSDIIGRGRGREVTI